MEEAIVDVALDLNSRPSEAWPQAGVSGEMCTDNRDQAQLLANMQKGSQASGGWPQNRAAWVEALRLSVVSGTYRIDSAELARCIAHNSTRFLETGLSITEIC